MFYTEYKFKLTFWEDIFNSIVLKFHKRREDRKKERKEKERNNMNIIVWEQPLLRDCAHDFHIRDLRFNPKPVQLTASEKTTPCSFGKSLSE